MKTIKDPDVLQEAQGVASRRSRISAIDRVLDSFPVEFADRYEGVEHEPESNE